MITLKKPQNGETVSLLRDIHKGFLSADRSSVTIENYDILDLKIESKDDSAPLCVEFFWEAPCEAEIVISESPDFTDCIYGFGVNYFLKCNFKAGTVYYWFVRTKDERSGVFTFETEAVYPRLLFIDGLSNVRDLGGWRSIYGKRIKQGLLYRGTELNSHHRITENGLYTMRYDLKISSDLDLRSKGEVLMDVYKGIYANIPCPSYDFLEHPENAKALFSFICNPNNHPIYMHCWGGADRTGILCFLIGCVLGMDLDDLIDDYEFTTLSIWGVRSRNSDHFKGFMQKFNALDGDTHNQKAEGFLLSSGITRKQIDTFRKALIEF